MKLELKHLTPYLPYNLQLYIYGQTHFENSICDLKWLDNSNKAFFDGDWNNITDNSEYFKPILRPLSDLTNEIEERENFKYLGNVKYCHAFTMDEKQVGILAMPYYVLEKLFKGNFDVFSLIEKGLAISVHDVCQADA